MDRLSMPNQQCTATGHAYPQPAIVSLSCYTGLVKTPNSCPSVRPTLVAMTLTLAVEETPVDALDWVSLDVRAC